MRRGNGRYEWQRRGEGRQVVEGKPEDGGGQEGAGRILDVVMRIALSTGWFDYIRPFGLLYRFGR